MIRLFKGVVNKKENKPTIHELQKEVKKLFCSLLGKKVTVIVQTNQETKEFSGILKKASGEIMGTKHQCLHFTIDINTHCVGSLDVCSLYEENNQIVVQCEPSGPGHYNKVITVKRTG